MKKTYYYISNIDGEIHNLSDVNSFIDVQGVAEILSEHGEVIDTVAIYDSLQELLSVIK